MISKKKEDHLFHSGEGRPHMEERAPEVKTTAERQRAQVIDLSDLQVPGKGPVNFIRKAGRTVDSFQKYWTDHDPDAEHDIA